MVIVLRYRQLQEVRVRTVVAVISVSHRVQALFRIGVNMGASAVEETKVFTLSEIDIQLEFLSNLVKYAKYNDKVECLAKIDEWLDLRIILTELESQYAH